MSFLVQAGAGKIVTVGSTVAKGTIEVPYTIHLSYKSKANAVIKGIWASDSTLGSPPQIYHQSVMNCMSYFTTSCPSSKHIVVSVTEKMLIKMIRNIMHLSESSSMVTAANTTYFTVQMCIKQSCASAVWLSSRKAGRRRRLSALCSDQSQSDC